MNLAYILLVIGSLLLTSQAIYSAALMLYVWEDERKRSQTPRTFEAPRLRFTLLLPARHEEQVIQDTIQRVVDLNYPRELVQVLIVIEAGDTGTIARVEEKLATLRRLGIDHLIFPLLQALLQPALTDTPSDSFGAPALASTRAPNLPTSISARRPRRQAFPRRQAGYDYERLTTGFSYVARS